MAQDILINDDGDLEIEGGDLVVGKADEQNILVLVNVTMGSLKHRPLAGIGIKRYLASSENTAGLKSNIVSQLTQDRFTNIQVNLRGNQIETFEYFINANRTE